MKSFVTVGRVNKPVFGFINIRADRQSVFGNPFYMSNESMRDEVCDKYAEYFNEQMQNAESPIFKQFVEVLEMLEDGKNINLQCWCAPKRCHCNTIKRWLDFNRRK